MMRIKQIRRLVQRTGRCSHCVAMSIADRDEDGDMYCVACGRPWMPMGVGGRRLIPIAGGAYSEVHEDTLVASVQSQRYERPVTGSECLNGKNGRFLGRSAEEIAEQIDGHCPLLTGEIDCECLRTFHRVSHSGAQGERCPDCGRCWQVRWDGRLVLDGGRSEQRAA